MLNMLGALQMQMQGKQRPNLQSFLPKNRQPQLPNYSEWSLRPEFRSDLGERAQVMEQMLRMFGPMMLGGGNRQNGLFYQLMAPPEAQPRQQFNPFSMLAFGLPPQQRNAFLDRFNALPFNRR